MIILLQKKKKSIWTMVTISWWHASLEANIMKKLRLSSLFVTKNIMKKQYCLNDRFYRPNTVKIEMLGEGS